MQGEAGRNISLLGLQDETLPNSVLASAEKINFFTLVLDFDDVRHAIDVPVFRLDLSKLFRHSQA